MLDIFSIRDASVSASSRTEIWRILIIRILFGKFSLYVAGRKTFIILKGLSFAKSNLLLDFIV